MISTKTSSKLIRFSAAAIGLGIAVAVAAGLLFVSRSSNEPSDLLKDVYERFDPEAPGRGLLDYPENPVADIPKGYAMILFAELERGRHGIRPEFPNLAHVAGHWLLDNAHLDPSGVAGWGVPAAWDAYGDGSINPASTAYSISTGIVVDALLDWMETDPSSPGERVLTTVHAALKAFAPEALRTPSGLLPYSLVETDRQYDTFNSGAYLAGQMQRFAKYGGDDRKLFEDAADATIASLVQHRQLSENGHWYWRYSIQENVSNDLAHASYIVSGIDTYVAEGGALSEKIDLKAVLGHLGDFVDDQGTVRGWPKFQTNIESPPRLYDIGMALTFACRNPSLSTLEERAKAAIPAYSGDDGFARYPPTPDSPDIVINEYEAYLWRGLVACEVAREVGTAARTSVAPINDRRAAVTTRQATVPPSQVTLYETDQFGGAAIVRRIPETALLLSLSGERKISIPISHSPDSAPEFRAAIVHNEYLHVVYYDNPTLGNYLVRYTRNDDGSLNASPPRRLPSLEDPAGGTYEMIPAVFLLPVGPDLHIVGGTLNARLDAAGELDEQRTANCSRAIEAVSTDRGVVVLCVQSVEEGRAAPFQLSGPAGVTLPSLGTGIPFALRVTGDQIEISEARSGADFAQMLRFDLDRLNGGWLEYGTDNVEGRIPWSQIYYLNGYLDFLLLSAGGGGWASFDGPMAHIRQRLDEEIQILNSHWLSGRFRTRAFSVDRSLELFAVQTARLLLLLDRYTREVSTTADLSALPDLRQAVSQLRDHIDVLARSGEPPWWIPEGHAHLAWPKGSAFTFDGLNVPYNHQNEWAYGVLRAGDTRDVAPSLDVIHHFLRRIAPEGVLPLTGTWPYWWGRAYDGWNEQTEFSVNTPSYPGDHGTAWISFRSIDVMSVLAAADHLSEQVTERLYASAARLVERGQVYPFVAYELQRAGRKALPDTAVSRRYTRISSPWEVQNAAWAYASLLSDRNAP
ncbi:MAG TPA: hypothetical protein PK271_03940 [Hyphomicrobium sp.]|uniref:hypothetical protein n=1 Tax=Hyphomicrobium sp. TaxID=82 RepID=UPI002CCA8B50|nr:hypothetical protein [Hyphomicrobium sp.]HRN87731.1 hypothetical protein [Hyphomicrobium sp.]